MNSHKHARLTPSGRALLCWQVLELGWKVQEASEAAGVSLRTAYKWLARFRNEGTGGLADRSSRPRRCPHATSIEQHQQFELLRRQCWPLWRIARHSGCSLTTLSRRMKRMASHGSVRCSRLCLWCATRDRRQASCCTSTPSAWAASRGCGYRITGDRTLNRNRGVGWDAVHLAIDDHS